MVTALTLTSLGAGLLLDSTVSAAPALIETTPPTEPPPETTPPDTAPSDTTPAESVPSDDDNTAILFLVLLIGVLIIGIVVIVSALNRRHAPPKQTSADAGREQHNLIGAAQWFHDQLSFQLMASPPDQALQRWSYERRRIESIVLAANQQARGPDDPWHLMANSVTLLMGSLDSLLGLRAQKPPNSQAIVEATTATTHRRSELQALLATMWPMVQGY